MLFTSAKLKEDYMTERLSTSKLSLKLVTPPRVAEHSISTGHNIKWDHFEILASGQCDLQCKIKETLLRNACLSGTGKGRKKGVRRSPPLFMLHKGLSQLVVMVIFFCPLSLLFPRTDHPPKNMPSGVTKVVILGQL